MSGERKMCLTCSLLGKCPDATLKMLENDCGCGAWEEATLSDKTARIRARGLAGSRALKAMLIKPPPTTRR